MTKRDSYKVEFERVRPSVIARDKNSCVKCGIAFSLEVHHIEGYKHNHPDSLCTLCYFCHGVAPMGREHFKEWMATGQSGIEVLEQQLSKHGVYGITREQIVSFCSALVKLDMDFRIAKFRTARERIRNSGVRCDGRKPYGTFKGEDLILARMVQMRAEGNTFRVIADVLNLEGILTRYAAPWRASTIARILARKDKYNP